MNKTRPVRKKIVIKSNRFCFDPYGFPRYHDPYTDHNNNNNEEIIESTENDEQLPTL